MSSWRQLELHPRIIGALRRADVKSVRDVLCMSGPDLQRLTSLSASDVQQLLTSAALACRRQSPLPVLVLHRRECHTLESDLRLSTGCPLLDRLLRGGLPVGGVTELSGESGVGKTQLALQLCLSVQYSTQHGGLNSGAVFVCAEDAFPSRRLQQLIREQSSFRPDVPSHVTNSLHFSDNVYVEHAADLMALHSCLTHRVPLLLARGLVRFVAVDSVASLFRSEFGVADWLERTRELLTVSSKLHYLSHEFNTPVLCINQVTDIFSKSEEHLGPSSSTVGPALGLAWANQVMVRLMMQRLNATVVKGNQNSALRRLEVVFAPHLARTGQDAAVWKEGVQGVETGLMLNMQ
ncbi:DNA repair protein XRCC3 isoform X1 [Nerophis lumbriciformis]|uniref:DNA repair protein XRCC3 isoform X1 n=1 Tax=Nerophis lumbriciformis TaxID=546530 RepID=UPI002ADF00A3|nr:DNA repair protein XRCC3-like isoform X1 [Nerophis lumbriciformis]